MAKAENLKFCKRMMEWNVEIGDWTTGEYANSRIAKTRIRQLAAYTFYTATLRTTTYVGKPSAMGQPTRPTQPFIHSGSVD